MLTFRAHLLAFLSTANTMGWNGHGHLVHISTSPTTSLRNSSDNSSVNISKIIDPSRFFELMSPIESAQPEQMSASALAYLGDVVFELYVRSRYVWPERRMSDLQNKVVSLVRGRNPFDALIYTKHSYVSFIFVIADAQAKLLKK